MNDDTISRSALIIQLTQQIAYFADKANTTSLIKDTYAYNYCKEGLILAKKIIENAPTTVEPERPQGEWARRDERRDGEYIGGFYHVNCPCEDGLFVKWPMKYCGNCGAPMEGGQP